ncbi:MAG TPA: right-handed parallel beta-helix repeat-containing protein [Candidatus Blautia faecigallinarum]|uniref:Right-handed parallel beta-helix repeat-containing protein n=1 Tax=Candidatus Blautia faecigallinarum TaxID=2838488 RepID=A0A9D2DRN0_9FIRM|nr:right-handed parallel beta-helix repeat-containing protein [Candidatus Blautia faecigallinarum]
MSYEYHVAVNGCDGSDGSREHPFRSISRAAEIAEAGDRVIVHQGTYREWVNPGNSGRSAFDRIVYEAAPGEKVIIKGSEQIRSWEKAEGTVWKAVIPNSLFGDFNPYKQVLWGDWLRYPLDYSLHLGDVYLNGKSFYEVPSYEETLHPVMRTKGNNPPWTNHEELILEPEQTIYVWFAQVEKEETIIYANFHEYDPNKELVEINIRPYCFYPEQTGINYITVRGFEMAQAACPWTPPTADQPALLGTHWSKGWVIEDNHIHDAKCSGISVGKEISTGHNLCSRYLLKPGYQNQLETVFLALQKGWDKETIGSHIIRNNVIHDCGQNAIVGHMGGAFSQIVHNHIYNIGTKHEFFGYEIAGIKLHAAIDTQIVGNNIHHTTLGIWMDWEAQGVRISGNLFYENSRDLMIEVTHGPCIMDNNIFGSDFSLDDQAQGTAFIHNLYCGVIRRERFLERATPYHFPHSTQVAGCAVVYSGDDRFYQNIFLGSAPVYTEDSSCGTAGFNDCTASLEEFLEKVRAGGLDDVDRFLKVSQPVYVKNNCYLEGAGAFDRERENFKSSVPANAKIVQKEDGTYLELDVPGELFSLDTKIYGTEDLGLPRIVGAPYDDPDGKPIYIDADYLGEKRNSTPVPGPFEGLKPGHNVIKIWE